MSVNIEHVLPCINKEIILILIIIILINIDLYITQID